MNVPEPMTAGIRARIDEYLVRVDDDRTLGDVYLREALAEVDRLRERDARIHIELRDRRADDLNVRGTLSPQPGTGPDPMIPFTIGSKVTPAVEWLVAEFDRLREQVERMRQDRPAYQRIADEAVAEVDRLHGLLCNVEYLEGRVREMRQADDFESAEAERDRDAAGGAA